MVEVSSGTIRYSYVGLIRTETEMRFETFQDKTFSRFGVIFSPSCWIKPDPMKQVGILALVIGHRVFKFSWVSWGLR